VGLTWFAPILPFTSEDVVPYLAESRTTFEKYGFDFYMSMLMLNPRSIICLMGILFDKRNPEEVKKAQELYDEMFDKLNNHNDQQYRTGIACWDRIWRESPELSKFYSLIKSTIDPNHILAPGKYGIN
jgi:4-cresol dehydrogenase (hydroxylating)